MEERSKNFKYFEYIRILKKNVLKKPFYTSRKAEVSSLKECIDELLSSYKLKGKLDQTHIVSSWEKIMGNPIAKRTVSLYFQEKKLFVKLNNDVGATLVEDIVFL